MFWYKYRPTIASHDLVPIIKQLHGGFKRLNKIDSSYQLWSSSKPVSINDVMQGFTVGNCYMIAAFVAMANQNGIVEDVFQFGPGETPGQLNKQGIVKLRVFVGGVPQKMLLDNLFSVTKEEKLMFAEPQIGVKNVWALFLEKAWAKLNVNYERTCAGWQHEVMRVFTGAAAKDYICSQYTVDELWNILKTNHDEGYILGSGTIGEGNDQF